MLIQLTIELTEEQVKKIGWGGLSNYADEDTTKEEVTDYLNASIQYMIDDLPLPPE